MNGVHKKKQKKELEIKYPRLKKLYIIGEQAAYKHIETIKRSKLQISEFRMH